MRTTKPISTISYNTPAYLKLKLDELVKAKKLSFYAFVYHKAEVDEKKNHIHLYAEPSKMIQTDDLKDFLKEIDTKNPDKPLSCISWHSSKFSDWYLYVLHDERYLASKQQSRAYHYTIDDVVSSDFDDLDDHISRIDMLALTPYEGMKQAIESGMTWSQYVLQGGVPMQQIKNFAYAWDCLKSEILDRAERHTHTPKSDINPDDFEDV